MPTHLRHSLEDFVRVPAQVRPADQRLDLLHDCGATGGPSQWPQWQAGLWTDTRLNEQPGSIYVGCFVGAVVGVRWRERCVPAYVRAWVRQENSAPGHPSHTVGAPFGGRQMTFFAGPGGLRMNRWTNGRTDGQTDGRTCAGAYRALADTPQASQTPDATRESRALSPT